MNPVPGATTVLYLDHTAKLSGGELALARLVEALDRRRVTPVALLAEEGPLAARLRAADVETHVLPLTSKLRDVRKETLGLGGIRHVGRVLSLVAYSARVARFARRREVDVLHTNSLKSDLYGALAGRMAGLPAVWHVRDHIEAPYLPRPAVHLFRFLARRMPAYVVTNSQSTLERLFLNGARPCAVVPSGIDRDLPEPDPVGDRCDGGGDAWPAPVRIGIVGRLAPWKGQHVFLEAAAQLRAAGHRARFLIIGAPLFGEEAYEAQLRQQVESVGLAGEVEFLGFQKDVPAVLRNLDILVHASTTPEPFGQVIIEGMAEGLPVIGTDGGGVREIITHGENGLLVPMGDAGALAQTLDALLGDPERARRLGRAGYDHVRQHFTVAQSARKVEQVYDEILAASGSRVRAARRTL